MYRMMSTIKEILPVLSVVLLNVLLGGSAEADLYGYRNAQDKTIISSFPRTVPPGYQLFKKIVSTKPKPKPKPKIIEAKLPKSKPIVAYPLEEPVLAKKESNQKLTRVALYNSLYVDVEPRFKPPQSANNKKQTVVDERKKKSHITKAPKKRVTKVAKKKRRKSAMKVSYVKAFRENCRPLQYDKVITKEFVADDPVLDLNEDELLAMDETAILEHMSFKTDFQPYKVSYKTTFPVVEDVCTQEEYMKAIYHKRTGLSATGNLYGKYNDLIEAASLKHGVDAALIRAVIHTESHFKPKVVSRAGASGLMQLMPFTAKRFGVKKIFDPAQNIDGGTRYLKWLLKKFDGKIELVAAGYNAGENAVKRYGGVPPYKETRHYVKKVKRLLKRYGNII